MPQLENFPTAQQATPNSCWACAAREISNWYQTLGKSGANPVYDTDEAFATAWANKTHDPGHADINVQQSAVEALLNLGYGSGADDRPFPTRSEITNAINDSQPLLAIVGNQNPHGKRNLKYQKGHWVVVVGISDNQEDIYVFDPDDGQIHTGAYNAATYQTGVYWQNASYVDSQ